MDKKFVGFVESLCKRENNLALCEAIKSGYNACYEAYADISGDQQARMTKVVEEHVASGEPIKVKSKRSKKTYDVYVRCYDSEAKPYEVIVVRELDSDALGPFGSIPEVIDAIFKVQSDMVATGDNNPVDNFVDVVRGPYEAGEIVIIPDSDNYGFNYYKIIDACKSSGLYVDTVSGVYLHGDAESDAGFDCIAFATKKENLSGDRLPDGQYGVKLLNQDGSLRNCICYKWTSHIGDYRMDRGLIVYPEDTESKTYAETKFRSKPREL